MIRGWGKAYESWLIDYDELWGETDQLSVWQLLTQLTQQSWNGLMLSRIAIDSGYQTPAGYQFCLAHKQISIATKGHDTLDKPFKNSISMSMCAVLS